MADKDYVPPMPDAVSLDVETCPKVCAGKAFIPPHRTDKTESDMEDIVIDGIARKRPTTIRYLCSFRRHLEVDTPYRWCACGKSADVLCDDSCGPLDLAPLEFKLAKEVTWNALCACRFTSAPPFCDGQHYEPQVGQDEFAEEQGLPLPPNAAAWREEKAALDAATKAAKKVKADIRAAASAAGAPIAAADVVVPPGAVVVPGKRPHGCTGACARAKKFAAAGVVEEIETVGSACGLGDSK